MAWLTEKNDRDELKTNVSMLMEFGILILSWDRSSAPYMALVQLSIYALTQLRHRERRILSLLSPIKRVPTLAHPSVLQEIPA